MSPIDYFYVIIRTGVIGSCWWHHVTRGKSGLQVRQDSI